MNLSKLIKLYNMVLIPIAAILFILLYVFIRARNIYGVYAAAILIVLSPFIAYYITKRITHV